MIKMQWLLLILNEKSTEKALVCLNEDIYFILCDIFIWFGVHFKNSFCYILISQRNVQQ